MAGTRVKDLLVHILGHTEQPTGPGPFLHGQRVVVLGVLHEANGVADGVGGVLIKWRTEGASSGAPESNEPWGADSTACTLPLS